VRKERAMKTERTFAMLATAGTLAAIALGLGCSDATPDGIIGSGSTRVMGSGFIAEEMRTVTGVTGVNMGSEGNVFIRQGGPEGLVVRGDDNLLDHVRTEVQSGTLRIRTEAGIDIVPTVPIEFHLTVSRLDLVELSGVGEIRANDLDAGHLTVDLGGVGDIDLTEVRADRIVARSSGLGDIRVSGETDGQSVRLEGAADYHAGQLRCRVAEVECRRSGSATVRVSDRLEATVRGSGSVYYIGSPEVHAAVTGTGGVVRIGD
jgi:hypothetical protein